VTHARSRYELFKPVSTAALFNNKCFYNTVEYALRHPGIKVIECMMVEDMKVPILHYVNFNPKTNQYLEVSIGFLADSNEYYKIREVHPDDYKNIWYEFDRGLRSWLDQFTTWFDRAIFNINRVC